MALRKAIIGPEIGRIKTSTTCEFTNYSSLLWTEPVAAFGPILSTTSQWQIKSIKLKAPSGWIIDWNKDTGVTVKALLLISHRSVSKTLVWGGFHSFICKEQGLAWLFSQCLPQHNSLHILPSEFGQELSCGLLFLMHIISMEIYGDTCFLYS